MRLFLLNAFIFLASLAFAEPVPDFKSDADADRWLRENSGTYLWMAESIDKNGGYDISTTTNYPGGVAYFSSGRGYIGLSSTLKGRHRTSILIFEITNLHQDSRHVETTQKALAGGFDTAMEFGLTREMIEYDGLRLHWAVLKELKLKVDGIPNDMFEWVAPAEDFDTYEPPFIYDYINAQISSGHINIYLDYFKQNCPVSKGNVQGALSDAKKESGKDVSSFQNKQGGLE